MAGTTPPGAMYVRALYDYEADDRTSLSFHEGDVIQVITQLDSGWWDGVINGVRGWFPSNYCQIITSPADLPDLHQNGNVEPLDDEVEEVDIYDDHYDHDDSSELDGPNGLPLEGTNVHDKSRADFWIPQATSDGRLFYYNMMTGDRSMELPLESPTSTNETGPHDRINLHIPDRTRPPAEMLARGMTQDEDDDSAASASEAEGESLMMHTSRNVRFLPLSAIYYLSLHQGLYANDGQLRRSLACLSATRFHRLLQWTLSMASLLMVGLGPTR